MFAATIQNNFLCYGKVAEAGTTLNWDNFWIRVNGFWVEITKQVGQPDYFLIPLDLARADGAFKETGYQNSICLETTSLTNSTKIYIYTTNRLDILQLFQSIQTGQKIIAQALERKQIERMVNYDVESAGGLFNFGKEKLTFRMTNQGIDLTGGKNPPQHYDLDNVKCIYAKQNHQDCHTHIILTIDENGQTVSKEYKCQDHAAVQNTIACFLMNTHLKLQQQLQKN